MFEKRLRILLCVLALAALVLLGRLGQLQIVHADYYRQRAERSLILTPTQLPFVRGSIRDRNGEVLVSDEPCWELTIDYGVIAAVCEEFPSAILREINRWKRAGRYPKTDHDEQVQAVFREEIAAMWEELSALTARSPEPQSAFVLRRRAREIYDRITGIRAAVALRRGFDAPVSEEGQPHAVLTGLDADQQITAREMFARYPWVHVEASSVRRFAVDAEPFAHVLGRMGRIDPDDVASDPEANDPFAEYRADERLGTSGVEYAAERRLRGRRGQITLDRDNTVIEDIEAEHGKDVTLTIHGPLQRRLYRLLGNAVHEHRASSGGAIVVLDVRTRNVLALVSYPSYDPSLFEELYTELRDDTDRLPLLFRAVSCRYPPGSTIKPLVCLAGLMNGRITPDSRENCTGYLSEENREAWRCWEVRGTSTRKAHGSINLVEALTGSCNIFMYRLGERLGVDRLCNTFDMAGVGRGSGIGLREDAAGINPTPGWLMANKHQSVAPGTARLFAIGQGELAMTPVQVANMMATYASGRYRPVTLIDTATPSPEWKLPATNDHWLAIRRGIYGVVNDPEGTAHKYVHFENDRFALCGKTGSATAHPWPTSYRVPYVDEFGVKGVIVVREGAKEPAIERFRREHPLWKFDPARVEVATRWPPDPSPDGDNYSHAWFAAFLQPLDAHRQPNWARGAPIAFAVLIEFGGSGAQTSGPLATQVAAEVLDVLDGQLDSGRLDEVH